MTHLDKNYWNNRYLTHETGWDIGYASPPLIEYCEKITNKTLRILIPGAGNAHELEYLMKAYFSETTIIDIAPTAIEMVKKRMPDLLNSHIICGDFFDHNGEYDLILEQTFFCALDPGLRQKYVRKCYELLSPGGKVAGVLFDFPLTDQGPPFGGSAEEYRKLFENHFQVIRLEKCLNSIPPRAGNELIFEIKKT